MRRMLLALVGFGLSCSVGCVGVRMTDENATVHAESLRIVGFAIPRDDQAEARRVWDEKCADYAVLTAHSTAADWTSILGVMGNLLSFHSTVISGAK